MRVEDGDVEAGKDNVFAQFGSQGIEPYDKCPGVFELVLGFDTPQPNLAIIQRCLV